MSIVIPQKNIPTLEPITVEVTAGTQRIISFPDEFFGQAVALFIRNNGTGVATYRYNGESRPLISLAAGATDTQDSSIVKLLEINANATGTVTVQAQVLKFDGVQ